MHHQQRAFSLLEILVVLTIMGLLSFIAIPSYQSYLVKTRMTELLLAGEPYKLALVEAFISGADVPKLKAEDLGLSLPAHNNEHVLQNISLKDGVLRLHSHTKLVGLSNHQHKLALVLVPNWDVSGSLSWTCHTEPQASHLHSVVPKACRPVQRG